MNAVDASNPVIVVPIGASTSPLCRSPAHHVSNEDGLLASPTFAVCVGVDFLWVVDAGGASTNLHKKTLPQEHSKCTSRKSAGPGFVVTLSGGTGEDRCHVAGATPVSLM